MTSRTLPSPIERSLDHQLKFNRMRWPDWRYAGLPDLLLQMGTVFTRGPLPQQDGRWSRKQKACFSNAYDSTLARSEPHGYLGLHLSYSAVSKFFVETRSIGSVLLAPEVGYRIFRGELPAEEILEPLD